MILFTDAQHRVILIGTTMSFLEKASNFAVHHLLVVVGVWDPKMKESTKVFCEKMGWKVLAENIKEAQKQLEREDYNIVLVTNNEKRFLETARMFRREETALLDSHSFWLLENLLSQESGINGNYSGTGAEYPSLRTIERDAIQKTLHHFGTTVRGKREAALTLGISLATLYNKIKYYRLIEE